MPKREVPLNSLSNYLPKDAYQHVIPYLNHYKVHLTIAKSRNTLLGDYRKKHLFSNHQISVNGTLNPYAFLITLLHELAHLITYEKYGPFVPSHGKQWKHEYGQIIIEFANKNLFPADVHTELVKTAKNPGASTNAEKALQRVLRNYDEKKEQHFLVEELPAGALFIINGGRVFRKGVKRKIRYECVEISSNKVYLFSPVYEVKRVG